MFNIFTECLFIWYENYVKESKCIKEIKTIENKMFVRSCASQILFGNMSN